MAIYRRDQPEYNAAVANGVKAIKLTTGGTFAGGKTWDGRQLNAPAPTGGSATPRLDAGVATPRLDKNPARNTAEVVANSNRNGAFGTGAQQLQARKDLFNQMAAAKPKDRAKFQGQAAALGVKRGGWDAAMGRLNMTEPTTTAPTAAAPSPAVPPVKPATQAKAPTSRPAATTGKINWDGTNPGASNWNKPASPIPPTRTGGAVPLAGSANSVIGRNPTAAPPVKPILPPIEPTPTVAAAPPPAQNFTVPTPAAVQPIAAPPIVRPPAPAPTPIAQPSQYGGRLNAKFSGPGGFSNPAHKQEMNKQNAAKAKRQAANKANLGKGSSRPGLLDRTLGGKPSWMSGSIAGSIYDGINK